VLAHAPRQPGSWLTVTFGKTNFSMHHQTCLARVLLAVVFATCCASIQAGTVKTRESISIGDETRFYVFIRPADLEVSRAYPVLFGFHGYRGEVKTWFHDYARFEEFAAEKRFIVVYPEAPIQWTRKSEGRDIQFFDGLMRRLKKDFTVDEKRIYVIGHSNGAAFASYLVQERPDVIAAAALHSGILSPSYSKLTVPEHKAPLLVFWGEKDELMPANSAFVKYSVADFERAGFSIELIVLPGWGHSWGGKSNQVEERILSFFDKHPLETPDDEK